VRTFSPKPEDIQRKWWVIDAEDLILGRLSTEAARLLRGKHKTIFAPHADTGDFVIIVNAAKIRLSSNKAEKTMKYRHSGYPGGITETSMADYLENKPEEMVRNAIRGMLPKNRLGRQIFTKLKVYAGPTHSHQAQQPQKLELADAKRAS
jgi:large subunit ribosomal protein L13